MSITIKMRKFSKREIRRWRSAGFKVLKNCTNKVVLEMPKGWKLIPVEKDIEQFIDINGNVRGAYTPNYSCLCCRYEIVSVKLEEKERDHIDSAETWRLYIVDRKEDTYILNLGNFEPYTDYEKDLREIAKMWLTLRFPNWRDESYYWED